MHHLKSTGMQQCMSVFGETDTLSDVLSFCSLTQFVLHPALFQMLLLPQDKDDARSIICSILI